MLYFIQTSAVKQNKFGQMSSLVVLSQGLQAHYLTAFRCRLVKFLCDHQDNHHPVVLPSNCSAPSTHRAATNKRFSSTTNWAITVRMNWSQMCGNRSCEWSPTERRSVACKERLESGEPKAAPWTMKPAISDFETRQEAFRCLCKTLRMTVVSSFCRSPFTGVLFVFHRLCQVVGVENELVPFPKTSSPRFRLLCLFRCVSHSLLQAAQTQRIVELSNGV